MWRVDYAAEGHGTWLSKTDDLFPTQRAAIKMAQQYLDRWDKAAGFRIVRAEHPTFQKITSETFGKIIDLDGTKLIPEVRDVAHRT